MPWRDVPAFVKKHVAEFKQGEATRAALLFLILTAARSGEVRGATWEEFDLTAGIWTIPAERMKAKAAHRVALSAPALALGKRLKEQKLHETLLFPSPRGKVLSDMVLTSFLAGSKRRATRPDVSPRRMGSVAASAIGPARTVTLVTLQNGRSLIRWQTTLRRRITARIHLSSASR